ncbi:MAG: tetratricopeptide repeat-containing sensor histidine kinase [Bacteroidetes bacterium]|nr:tetratricopeptide repeat-containing sensor histidine kinase [Bacteroidota bacterium]
MKGDSSQFRAWIYSTTNNNLGMIELNRKSFNSARDYFKASLKYKIENPFSKYDSVPIAFTYYLLGKTEFEAGNYEKSREYWNIGSPIADKFDIMEFVFYFSLLNARLLFTEGKIDQSYRELFRAFHLLERKNTNPLGVQESQPQIDADLLTIYDLFINIHSFQGKSDSMLYYYKLHQDLSYKLDMKSAYSAYIQMLAEKDIENMSTMLKKSNEQRKVYLAGLAILLLFLLIVLEYTRRIRIIRKKLSEKQAELLKTNEYLINLGKELQQSNTAKDKFFSVLAHDLKNPFNALKGFNELLAESIYLKDLASSKIYADIIRYSTDNIYDLLINLLEWSKIHSGRITFSPEQVSIESLFNESVSKQAFQASHKQISLEVNFEADAVMTCDRYMMLSIIRNILSNAIRLTPDKGKIAISYYKKGDKHQISITDTGPGMCPELIEKVFGKGKSVDVPGDKKNSDRGLGIIIVKDFLNFHKGTIEVISELGMGCNVIIQIPA